MLNECSCVRTETTSNISKNVSAFIVRVDVMLGTHKYGPYHHALFL